MKVFHSTHLCFSHIVALPWFPLWLKNITKFCMFVMEAWKNSSHHRRIAGTEAWSREDVFGKYMKFAFVSLQLYHLRVTIVTIVTVCLFESTFFIAHLP